jgi:hypothetical protein
VSAAFAIAQDVLDRERLFDVAHWRDQRQVHAVIVGFSHLGRACLAEAIFAGIAGHLGMPHITILDDDPAAVRAVIDRDLPELDQSATILVKQLDRASFTAAGPLAEIEAQTPITAVFICLDDEARAIAAMTALARLQQRADRALASVHVLAENPWPAARLACPLSTDRDVARRFTVDAGLSADRDLIELLTVRHDATARRLHEAYRQKFDSASGSSTDWDNLPETYRDSNRRAARHLQQKLWTAGLIEPAQSGAPADVDPTAYRNIIAPSAHARSEDALIRRLSRLEHERWCADRRLEGWRFASIRDDRRRLHPNLVPFDDPRFTDADIAKDADQVRFLFADVVRSAADGASAPLVLGIVTRAPAGIDAAAGFAAAERDDWRPVLVISPLIDEAEVSAAQSLLARLDGLARRCRLAVPEIAHDNQPLRHLSASSRQMLSTLLARPTTRVVPIAAAPPDAWRDPDEPDRERQDIARYVAARATAVIDPAAAAPAPARVAAPAK